MSNMTENKIQLSTALALSSDRASLYSDVSGLSLQSLYYANHGSFPSCFMPSIDQKSSDYRYNTKELLRELKEDKSILDLQYVTYTNYNIDKKESRVGVCLAIPSKKIYARIETDVEESYFLYDDSMEDEFNWFNEVLMKHYYKLDVEKNNIWKIAAIQGGYTLLKSKINECADLDINKLYNDDFADEDSKIKEFIAADNQSGLIILHGEKGTGKTTYIRNLITSNPEKKFVFVPAGLIPLLGDPSFATFLGSLTNSVIILEDCEGAIKSRKSSGNGSAVSLILNMTDGLLSDDLCTKFICTFNDDTKNIDEALLRKGRLVSKYEFKKLNKDKSDALLAELYTFDENEDLPHKDMTLADIFNYKERSYDNERKSII